MLVSWYAKTRDNLYGEARNHARSRQSVLFCKNRRNPSVFTQAPARYAAAESRPVADGGATHARTDRDCDLALWSNGGAHRLANARERPAGPRLGAGRRSSRRRRPQGELGRL